MSAFIADGGGDSSKGRMQVDNADQPPGQTPDDHFQQAAWDSADENHHNYQTVERLTAAAHTIDLDASRESDTKVAEDRIIFAVTMDLAPLQPPPVGFSDMFLVPDEATPGMNVNVQIIGQNFTSIDTVRTNSSDIVVGPILVYDKAGNVVDKDGVVLSTIFFIDKNAVAGAFNVTVAGANLTRTFNITDTTYRFAGTGDYTGKTGFFTLGDNKGINGNRTIGGTIVLDELLVPVGVTLNITAQDIDPTRPGNQGFLPAIILVDGEVDIQGTIWVNGSNGYNFTSSIFTQGGQGGPGGGGGGAGSRTCSVSACVAGTDAARGGHGFSGGGGGGIEATDNGGDGGDGTGIAGDVNVGQNGGDGGYGLYGNKATNGTGGDSVAAGGNAGAGGSGWPFGLGGNTNTYGGAPGISTPQGRGGGGGGGSSSESDGGGGGGFGRAGENAAGLGGGLNEAGAGGAANGNDQMVPFSGGSGGGANWF